MDEVLQGIYNIHLHLLVFRPTDVKPFVYLKCIRSKFKTFFNRILIYKKEDPISSEIYCQSCSHDDIDRFNQFKYYIMNDKSEIFSHSDIKATYNWRQQMGLEKFYKTGRY